MNDTDKLADGTKNTLVFLHGWGMNAAVWDDVVQDLSEEHNCLALDLPGYGEQINADLSPVDYTLENVAAFVEQQIPQNSILVGWSLGGLVASYIALNFPKKIKALVCVASSPKFESDKSWHGVKPMVLDLFHRQLSDDHAKTLSRFIAIQMQGIADMNERKLAIRTLTKRLLAKPQPDTQVLDKGLDILGQTDLRLALNELSVPRLRMYGRCDSLVPAKAIEAIKELDTDADTIVYAKSSHAPFIDERPAFVSDLKAFLNKHRL